MEMLRATTSLSSLMLSIVVFYISTLLYKAIIGISRPVFRGKITRVELPPQKSLDKNFWDYLFCWTVVHVQLKNVTVDVMNIIVTITVGVKCAQCASKCTILKEKIHFFLGRGTAPPQTQCAQIKPWPCWT